MLRLFSLLLLLLSGLLTGVAQAAAPNLPAIAHDIARQGDALLADYHPQQGEATGQGLSRLYFDVFEARGMELALGARDPARRSRLEASFSQLIAAAMQGEPAAALQPRWQTLRTELLAVARDYGGGESSFGLTLLQSMLILLREGFEAILVVGALAAYLRKLQANDKLPLLYGGVGLAVLASGVLAWVFASVLSGAGRYRDALEGSAMLLAALVLFYVGYWLISKREAERWQQYVRSKIGSAVGSGSAATLTMAAFLAVFREGVETVLFYEALHSSSSDQAPAFWSGIGLGGLALIGLYWGIHRASVRLPLKTFFSLSATLLLLLAVVFAGQGLAELQTTGWLQATPAADFSALPALGLYPTREGLLLQGGLLLAILLGAAWSLKRPSARAAVN